MGYLSDTFVGKRGTSAEALRQAMLYSTSMFVQPFFMLFIASTHVEAEEASRLARALGEDI